MDRLASKYICIFLENFPSLFWKISFRCNENGLNPKHFSICATKEVLKNVRFGPILCAMLLLESMNLGASDSDSAIPVT